MKRTTIFLAIALATLMLTIEPAPAQAPELRNCFNRPAAYAKLIEDGYGPVGLGKTGGGVIIELWSTDAGKFLIVASRIEEGALLCIRIAGEGWITHPVPHEH